jgi:hypothetical protein
MPQKQKGGPASSGAPSHGRFLAGNGWKDRARRGGRQRLGEVDFAAINAAALAQLPSLLARWLPDGRACGGEYVARNPRRVDRHAGSFKINLRSGRWADFSTGDRGGDVISLAAYLQGTGQAEAARRLAAALGLGGLAP